MKNLLIILVVLLVGICAESQNLEIEYLNSILWNGIGDVIVDQDIAYCAFNYGLFVIDVSNSEKPDTLSSLFLPFSNISGRGKLFKRDNILYFAKGKAGLIIIDISEPNKPSILSHFNQFYDNAMDIHVVDTIAFVCHSDRIDEVNIKNPSNPILIKNIYNSLIIEAYGVFINNDFLFIADNINGLIVYNISNPNDPYKVGACHEFSGARQCYVNDNIAYIAAWSNGLQVVDVSDPSNPQKIGEYKSMGSGLWAGDIFFDNNIIYIANSTDAYFKGLYILDISEPTNPDLISNVNTENAATSVYVEDEKCYLTSWNKLGIIDISNINYPQEIGNYATTSNINDIALSGTIAFVACGPSGLIILEIQDPLEPNIIAYFTESIDNAQKVFFQDDIVYILDQNNVDILNVANPSEPAYIDEFNIGNGAYDIYVDKTMAYVTAMGGSGVQIWDLIDLESPLLRIDFPWFDTPGIFVSDGLAYLASWQQGNFGILNVEDPDNPFIVDTIDVYGFEQGVYIEDDLALVASYYGGLQVVDIGDPYNLEYLGDYRESGWYANAVEAIDNKAFVVGQGGLKTIDVSDPTNPKVISSLGLPGSGQGIAINDSIIYIADGCALTIVKLKDATTDFISTDFINGILPSYLSEVYPNPFNSSVVIEYSIASRSRITIEIYNILGQKIRTLLDEILPVGEYRASWDGSDLNGERVATGIYFCCLKMRGNAQTKKILLLK